MPVWAVPLKPTILLQLGFKVLSHLQKVPKSLLFPWKLRRIWLASCYSSRWEVLRVLVEHPRRTWTSPSIACARVSVHLARYGAVIDYYSIFFFPVKLLLALSYSHFSQNIENLCEKPVLLTFFCFKGDSLWAAQRVDRETSGFSLEKHPEALNIKGYVHVQNQKITPETCWELLRSSFTDALINVFSRFSVGSYE